MSVDAIAYGARAPLTTCLVNRPQSEPTSERTSRAKPSAELVRSASNCLCVCVCCNSAHKFVVCVVFVLRGWQASLPPPVQSKQAMKRSLAFASLELGWQEVSLWFERACRKKRRLCPRLCPRLGGGPAAIDLAGVQPNRGVFVAVHKLSCSRAGQLEAALCATSSLGAASHTTMMRQCDDDVARAQTMCVCICGLLRRCYWLNSKQGRAANRLET